MRGSHLSRQSEWSGSFDGWFECRLGMGPFVEDDECSDEAAVGPYALGQRGQRLSNAPPVNEVANRGLGSAFEDGLPGCRTLKPDALWRSKFEVEP